MNWKNNVIEKFGNKAESYDDNSEIQKIVANALIDELPTNDQAVDINDILEVGCGTGQFTNLLFDRYSDKNICISDISASMVTNAQVNCQSNALDNGHKTRWAVFDAEFPPDVMKGSFDLIVANMVLQWFENPQDGIENLKDLLRPGGKIIYSMIGEESFKEWRDILTSLNLPVGMMDIASPKETYKDEFIIKTYKNASSFLNSIKNIGAGQAKKGYKRLSLREMKQACDAFDSKYDTSITWHILYGSAQKEDNGIKKLIGLKSK